MTRSTPEWIGKTDDTPAPPRVRLRVFERFGGVCQITGRKIQTGDQWDLDHEVALINGGENRESNLRPVLRTAHRKKTAEDVRAKAKSDRIRKKHLGLHKTLSPLPGGRGHHLKRTVDGRVINRETGEPV